MSKTEKRSLGRGLSALMGDVSVGVSVTDTAVQHLPIEQITPNPDQPRRDFAPEALAELSQSLKRQGVLQPLLVRRHPEDRDLYQIVAGERRWRAAQIAQLHELPVIIRDLTDAEVLEFALIENIQRADLNAVEEASSYRQLMDRFGHTQEQLAEVVNKSRSHISNVLRLLNLPEAVLLLVREGKLSAGHARALITSPDPLALARRVVERGLSVRETEQLVRDQLSRPQTTERRSKGEKDADTRALEGDLTAHLKMRVRIDHQGQDGGRLTVAYKDLDQLDRLCQILAGT
ncbi:MAG: chromosome partitioning protein ParB [Paracoccus denitrificans]|nr:MAG: chromosome partitioning protein ParB [Paracoccus denitrificans]PZO85621.1 MAG: chromosome partitioning protein ParB [Paracoccus denitrificans]